MRLVSWNIGKRTQHGVAVLDHLDELAADVVLLQESRIHDLAKARGWQRVRAAESPSDCVILARQGCTLRRAEPSAVSQLGRYIAHAELTVGARTIDIFSVHPLAHRVPLPGLTHLRDIDVERSSDPSVWWSDLFFYLIGHATAGRSAVVGGDWDTSRIFQDSLFDRAAAAGWCEVLHHVHGQQQRTWFRGEDRPHGLDHVFCTRDLQDSVKDAFVDASVADSAGDHSGRGLSDHAPVIVSFDISALTVRP